jgi:hypothetical protein
MSEWLKETEKVVEARALREIVCVRLFGWSDNFRKEDPTVHYKMLKYLVILLKCADPDFMFWNSKTAHEHTMREQGVEQHVLDGLRALGGPHGYTYYRMLLLKKEKQA